MPLFVTGALTMLAKGALTAVVGPFVEEARDAALSAAENTLREKVAGRMSIEEWAEIVIEGVDKVKARAIEEENLRFIGGKMKFALSENVSEMVTVSFQLYFMDQFDKWKKAEADTDIPATKFSETALDNLRADKEIIYEVE